jgi:transcriptional regulator with XRE-family HTH domain
MQTLADRVKKRIAELGLNVNSAALRCDIKPPRLYDIVKGITLNPAGETVIKLAEGLDTSETWILRGTEDAPERSTQGPDAALIEQAAGDYRGQLIKLSRNQFIVASLFNQLSDEQQDDIIDITAIKAALK